MVCVRPDIDDAEAIVAGAALSQQFGAALYVVSVLPPARRRFAWTRRSNQDAVPLHARLAETLGATMVTIRSAAPAEGAAAFARREGVTHVIFGQGRPQPLLSPESMVQQFSHAVRGVEVRVVARKAGTGAASKSPASGGRRLLWAAGLLFAVIAAAAAISLAPWPVMFLPIVIVAATWCWRLDRPRST
jgi:K+-sensing histidine kinase KdpD